MLTKLFYHFGRYYLMLNKVFSRPENLRIYKDRLIEEIDILGVKSLGIVVMLSFFMGAVVALQTASNIDSPLIPSWSVGFATRESVLLEFSSTILSLILAGKVGSVIASEIGTMRVTQQIDALEIMGINSCAYLILPKVVASMLIIPFLVCIAMGMGMAGGYMVCYGTGVAKTSDYIAGLQIDFDTFSIVYSLIKSVVFAFIISTVSSYQGYYTDGGSLEVGQSSTRAVVYSSVLILVSNYVITQILLI